MLSEKAFVSVTILAYRFFVLKINILIFKGCSGTDILIFENVLNVFFIFMTVYFCSI